ncbi:MAG: hypothetical protein VXY51_04030, partial [Pseudomonadota bacterium]|nr:hypothetical protein [Pseudomonadota bacterium]
MPGSMMQPDLSVLAGDTGVRADALARWQDGGWPGPRVEAWRFTRVDQLADRDLVRADALTGDAAGPGAAAAASMGAHVIRFENGVLDTGCLDGLPDGVTAREIATDETALQRLAELAPNGHPVSDLSMAAMTGGIVIEVSGAVAAPLMLLFEGGHADCSAHPAIL